MLGMGMASSHAPMMFQKAQYWPRMVERIPAEAREHLPHSARVEIATPAMIGGDQGDMFDEANNPTFSVYTGEEPIWGRSARDAFGIPPAERTKLVFPQHAELARHLHRGLIKRGFDVASVGRFDPRGNPARGVSHMVSNLVPEVDPALSIPLVCVFINEYYPPLPSAVRCAQLGVAIAEALRDRPERIAIYASGGLSHFPGMYNAGWISVAAAMNRRATIVDYIPAHCTQTGCGFVHWPV